MESQRAYTEEQFETDLGRLKKASGDGDRFRYLNPILNNFFLSPSQAAQFVRCFISWDNILKSIDLIYLRLEDDSGEEFVQILYNDESIVKFPEDREALEEHFEEVTFKLTPKVVPKVPKVNGTEEYLDEETKI
eukprot:snap_masked-scaffold_25-processed-gene-1.30-mRNA-1 protein AED:1.00 eAED:1.00 QI:0/-1/0/0/-1/1/1/0/133